MWHFSFGSILVLVTFQLKWHFSFGDISVLVTIQSWGHFCFGDISVLVIFQFWWNINLVTFLFYNFWVLTLKLPEVRSKFKTKFHFIFLSKLENFLQMFSVAIPSHCIKEKMYKFRKPRKNQHLVYFYPLNLKVGPFSPPPGALGL